MEAALLVSLAAFLVAAVCWFFAWAIWIHTPDEWEGGETTAPILAPERPSGPERPSQVWYRGLKVTTLVLLVLTFTLFGAWYFNR